MPTEQKPKVTPPQKSYTKLLIGLAILILLMFAMIAAIIVRLIDKKP